MTEAFMAYPDQRHPFQPTPIHADGCTTVLHAGQRVTLDATGEGPGLLIRPDDLERVNGFTLKPEGACRGDICIPLTENMLVTQDGTEWFDVLAFADHTGQTYVADEAARVWSFAEVPAQRAQTLHNAMAPDLEITDRAGNVIRLADLKGKKALIVTWSSW